MRRREPRVVVRPARLEVRRVPLVTAARLEVAGVMPGETADRVRRAEIATIEIGRRVRR